MIADVGLGCVGFGYTARGLALVTPPASSTAGARRSLDMMSDGPPPTVVTAAEEPAAAVLAAYFAGERVIYSEPVDLTELPPFRRRALATVRHIPYGETRTYGWVAGQLGRPTAARAVGRALGANPLAPLVPCHRVVGADGRLTGYHWGLPFKRWLLRLEGVELPF